MDIIKLQSGPAIAEIMPQRGALISKLHLADDADVLWMPKDFDARSKDWPGGGLPFLFPFAGRVQHQGELYKYGLGGKVYPMPIHGFSWSTEWDVLERLRDRTRLQMRSTPETRTIYPFDFSIIMEITLSAKSLQISVEIRHQSPSSKHGEQKMPVAMGWHPYFSIRQHPTRLELKSKTVYPVTEEGMAGKPLDAATHLGAGPWPLPKTELSSLILGQPAENSAKLLSPNTQLSIKASPTDLFNYFVTWTNQPSEFLCVEPWMAQPNAVAAPTGCRWLASQESLFAGLTITAS
jgi:glucose-6-phosphate 1-epimerase